MRLARDLPEWNYLGIDVRLPMVQAALAMQQSAALSNLHFMWGNANVNFARIAASLPVGIVLFFWFITLFLHFHIYSFLLPRKHGRALVHYLSRSWLTHVRREVAARFDVVSRPVVQATAREATNAHSAFSVRDSRRDAGGGTSADRNRREGAGRRYVDDDSTAAVAPSYGSYGTTFETRRRYGATGVGEALRTAVLQEGL